MNTLVFLCALSLLAALQVPGTLTEEVEAVEEAQPLMTTTERSEIVNKHNALRRGVSPTASNMLKMSWNKEAEANAQRWANTCFMNHSLDSSREISTSGCGENLYMASSKNTWNDAIQSWYNEVKDWRYGVGSVNGQIVGHFTQIVWYRSNQIGCAMAYCPNSKYRYFYVCHYCPPGNEQFARPYKSGPTCADCPNACENKLCTNPCPYSDMYSNCPDMKEQIGCGNSQVASWCPASWRPTIWFLSRLLVQVRLNASCRQINRLNCLTSAWL
ncbi:cysteine-rich venom protein TEL1 isoform X1 [Cynoglossus semilaevis]|uniref:cysteine-rich venom protein TEL1 isoform X1 n=2 Tax=Cynoglossus semilaevis TaxID=244447 RepID=UPI000D62DFC8|nr:cysteine-rich venom protein TEL1-like isoform X1 [Cynoglossus semilaevis]XP_016889335.2 cysteine-rich venom protein TEL1-like isoform X1 [Cynoglossus semilaevis]XP_024912634.1 cysteine-rich venom protein TEL1-like isoform X1 [Cynoglossus semilaevis]